LCVDEMMVKYIGKYSPIWQYMKVKPWGYGIKVWRLVNVKSKLVYKMELCYGTCHEDVEHAIWYKIAYMLMDRYKNNNYIVTFDNFLFNLKLFWYLLKVGVHTTRTNKIDCKGWSSTSIVDPKRGSRRQF
jgi:hypothetical protein